MDVTTVNLTLSEYEKKLPDSHYGLTVIPTRQHLTLPPKYLGKMADGIREQLNSRLKLYSEDISGVPVAYRSVHLVENYGYLMDSQPYIHVDVNVEYIVFCPREGSTVRAVVNQKSNDHMSGLVLGLFNIAVTLRSKHGNEMKSRVNIGQELLLKVTNIYVCNGILSMRGRLRHQRGTTANSS